MVGVVVTAAAALAAGTLTPAPNAGLTVSGPQAALLAWLTGRAKDAPLQATPGDLPPPPTGSDPRAPTGPGHVRTGDEQEPHGLRPDPPHAPGADARPAHRTREVPSAWDGHTVR